jgi:hypothetical protein
MHLTIVAMIHAAWPYFGNFAHAFLCFLAAATSETSLLILKNF